MQLNQMSSIGVIILFKILPGDLGGLKSLHTILNREMNVNTCGLTLASYSVMRD